MNYDPEAYARRATEMARASNGPGLTFWGGTAGVSVRQLAGDIEKAERLAAVPPHVVPVLHEHPRDEPVKEEPATGDAPDSELVSTLRRLCDEYTFDEVDEALESISDDYGQPCGGCGARDGGCR